MWLIKNTYNSYLKTDNVGIIYLPVNAYSSANAAIGYLYLNDPTLASVYSTFYFNQIVNVAAWGKTTQAATTTSGTLKYTTMKIIDEAGCRTAYVGSTGNELCIVSGSTSQTQVDILTIK